MIVQDADKGRREAGIGGGGANILYNLYTCRGLVYVHICTDYMYTCTELISFMRQTAADFVRSKNILLIKLIKLN